LFGSSPIAVEVVPASVWPVIWTSNSVEGWCRLFQALYDERNIQITLLKPLGGHPQLPQLPMRRTFLASYCTCAHKDNFDCMGLNWPLPFFFCLLLARIWFGKIHVIIWMNLALLAGNFLFCFRVAENNEVMWEIHQMTNIKAAAVKTS
jgi:hypothetical protein